MKKKGLKEFYIGVFLLIAFGFFTIAIIRINVKTIGVNGTCVGFSALNGLIRELFGVHFALYVITDWLGLLPLSVCFGFGVFGFLQLIKRKSLFKVDCDIIILGIYYIVVIFFYLIFEIYPVNYRPILINGYAESSYPSSTTLLVLCVMPSLTEQIGRRAKKKKFKRIVLLLSIAFSAFMIIARLVSGAHWFTDILGSFLLGLGLFYLYKSLVTLTLNRRK